VRQWFEYLDTKGLHAAVPKLDDAAIKGAFRCTDNAENAAKCVALSYDNISTAEKLFKNLRAVLKTHKNLVVKLASKLDVETEKKKPPPLPSSAPPTATSVESPLIDESSSSSRRKAMRFDMTPVKNRTVPLDFSSSAPSTDPILKRSMNMQGSNRSRSKSAENSSFRVRMQKSMKPIRGRLYKQTKHVKAWELREVWLEGTSLKYCSTMLGDMNGHKNNAKIKHASLSQRISLSREHIRFVDLRGAVVRNIDVSEMRQLKGRGYGFEISAIPPQSSSSNRTTWKWTRLLFSSDTLEDRTRWTRAICIASGLHAKIKDRKMETTFTLEQIKKQVQDFEAITLDIQKKVSEQSQILEHMNNLVLGLGNRLK